MGNAARIIDRFGGITALARALDPKMPPSVVQGWKQRGYIPARRQREVLAAGQSLSPPLTIEEFFAVTESQSERADRDRIIAAGP
jgi:hypothetical protein